MPESEVLVSPPRTTSERGAPGKLGLIASPKTVRHPRPPEDSNTSKTLKIEIVLRNRSMELEIRQSSAHSFLKSSS